MLKKKKISEFKRGLLVALLALTVISLAACDYTEVEEELKANAEGLYESLLLEEEKSVMNYYNKNSEGYYDYYENISYNIEHFNLDYKIEAMDLIRNSRKNYTMKVIVNVSGVDKEDVPYTFKNSETLEWIETDNGWKIDKYTTEYTE